MVDRVQAKMAAKNCMRTARVSPYQIGAVFFFLSLALNGTDSLMTRMFHDSVAYGTYTYVYPAGPAVFVGLLVALILQVLQAGFYSYCLGIRRGKEMPVSSLFDGFALVGKIILLEVVMGIFIFLWSLLLFIPGIIASYRYYFALINLLENPDLGIMECIRLSKEQTQGYKWQLFVLDLSFLGWIFLSACTLGILSIWLNPYMLLTQIAFYDTICASKGLSAGGNADSDWAHGESSGAGAPYEYDWNAQSQSWDSAPRNDAPQAGADAQPEQPSDPWDRSDKE